MPIKLKSAYKQIESFNNGDEQSFSYFFDLHYKSLCYFAYSITQDTQQSEDIVAECFFKLWQKKSDFQTEVNIKAFLYISCRNACFNYLRNNKRKTNSQDLYLSQLELSEEPIFHLIIETDVLDILNLQIEELPEKCKQVFKMLYFEKMKTDEIALKLDISVKTVRGHKAKAIELLKAKLYKKGLLSLHILVLLSHVENL